MKAFTKPLDAVGSVPPAMSFDLNFRIEFTGESFEIKGRGTVHTAKLVAAPPCVKRDAFNALLYGQRVAGRGTIIGVESFAMMHIGEGASIGLLFQDP